MDAIYIVLVVAILIILAGGFLIVIRRPAPTPAPTRPIRRATMPPTAPPTPAPTPAPTPNNSQLAIPLAYTGLMPLPPGPAFEYYAAANIPQYHLVPGAAWPILVGRNRETVNYWLLNTYPRLNVRALPLGSPTLYEARNDRITVLYDPYTNRVISARIG